MDLSPGKLDLSIYRGDSRRWEFVLWADSDKAEPVDLTGVVVQAQIQTANSPVVTMECTVTLPNTVVMYLSAQNSKSLAPSKGRWDLQLTYPGGDVSTAVAGNVLITADVTVVGGVHQ